MENKKYDYAVGYGGKVVYRGIKLFKGGPIYKVFYKGLKNWTEDFDLSGHIDWLCTEEEALKTAINLGMSVENFYK